MKTARPNSAQPRLWQASFFQKGARAYARDRGRVGKLKPRLSSTLEDGIDFPVELSLSTVAWDAVGQKALEAGKAGAFRGVDLRGKRCYTTASAGESKS
jgi:hypothetical protein